MTKDDKIDALAISMEQTMEMGNLSAVGEIGEVAIDAVLEDGILRDIPIIGAITGVGKCVKNVSDMLFTNKLIAFLFGLKDTEAREREAAVEKWENSARYRIHVGETLLNMINRCDDTQKAKWLSKLFYHLVLKQGYGDLFMRAEKALSSLSVMDVISFLNQPRDKYSLLTLDEAEWYSNSGLYVIEDKGMQVVMEYMEFPPIKMRISEVGMCIYNILNDLTDD